jgi:hypothetical protein
VKRNTEVKDSVAVGRMICEVCGDPATVLGRVGRETERRLCIVCFRFSPRTSDKERGLDSP